MEADLLEMVVEMTEVTIKVDQEGIGLVQFGAST
jgi:hypothetical protein